MLAKNEQVGTDLANVTARAPLVAVLLGTKDGATFLDEQFNSLARPTA